MNVYLVRRLLYFVPTLFGASLLIFALMRMVPGDIAEILVYQTGGETADVQQREIQRIRRELGLGRPLAVQYLDWAVHALRGDFGYSYTQRRPVADILAERFPRSMELAVLTMCLAVAWAVPAGVLAALHHNRWVDRLVQVASLGGLSIPLFVTGLLILYVLVRVFQWLPPLEFTAFLESPSENLKQMIWPALAQAYYISAPIARLTRSQMLDVLHEDYVRTARAKGLAPLRVVFRHGLANALLPVVTFIAWWGGRMLGGVVIMESIFVVPGIGTALVQAVSYRDYPTVQAIVFVMALTFLIINLVIDLLYGWLDPRIRHA